MSKKEEILHKLSTEDRNYIKEKFKEKDAKIQQLEHRLSNCIEPKFKVGQIVWHCYKNCNAPVKTVIESIDIEIRDSVKNVNYYDIAGFGFRNCDLFATEEEAKVKLREIQNG